MSSIESWVDNWEEGRSQAEAALKDATHDDAKQLLYEICAAVAARKLMADDAVSLMVSSECGTRISNLASSLADIFWMQSAVCESLGDPDEARSALASMMQKVLEQGWVTQDLLKARCEADLLIAAGIITDSKLFDKKVVRVKTQLIFTQTKFNLLREESEGYSKVVTELCQGKTGVTVHTAPSIFEHIQALIGYFDLDPNRCFDLVLEAFEQDLSNREAFLALVSLFKPSHACVAQIVGFKFRMYAKDKQPTPSSLQRLAAILIQSGHLRIEDLYIHLTPTDAVARQAEATRKSATMEAAKTVGLVSLSSGKERPAEVSTKGTHEDEHNQKFGLLDALLMENDLVSAETLFQRVEFMRPASHPSVARGLCSQLHDIIGMLYQHTAIHQTIRLAMPTAKAAKKEKNRDAEAGSEPDVETAWDLIEQRVAPLLRYLGVHVACDKILLVKVCRTFRHYLAKVNEADKNSSLKDRVHSIVEQLAKVALLPGLALIPTNPGLGAELWGLLSLLPYVFRFQIYGYVKTSSYADVPELILKKAAIKAESMSVMKRISNDSVKQQGRALGKLSHSNPIAVFERVVDTVHKMPNITTALVKSLRYITPLSFDVLTFMIIEALSDPAKSRMKDDGANIAEWLTSLAKLAAQMCRQYATVELSAFLKYVAQQLISGTLEDLVLLRELVGAMSGLEAIEDLPEEVFLGQTGGATLRNETAHSSGGTQKATPKTTRRLKESMIDSRLAVPLLVLLGQQGGSCVFVHDENRRQLKVIGEVYDKCHETFLQLVMFLTSALQEKGGNPFSAYAQLLPSMEDLILKHQVQPEAAFHICRCALEDTSSGRAAIANAVQGVLPATTWDNIDSKLYTTFWSLSLYDIDVPKKLYADSLNRLQQDLHKIEDDRSLSNTQVTKRKKEKNAAIKAMNAEKQAQDKHHSNVMGRLRKEAPGWFREQAAMPKSLEPAEGLNVFTQCCIFPRVLFSQLDAAFCARFVHKMHQLKTPNFSVLLYYDKVIKQVASAVTCCTRNEALRLGRFLAETLKLLEHWKSDAAVYRRECLEHPGFKKSFTEPNPEAISYFQFVKVNFKWHQRLLDNFSAGLTKDYTEMRNCMIVLRAVVDQFPAIKKHYAHIETKLETLEADKRDDIKIMALSYRARLKKREPVMMTDEDFKKEAAKPVAKIASAGLNKSNTSNMKSTTGASAKGADIDINSKRKRADEGNGDVRAKLPAPPKLQQSSKPKAEPKGAGSQSSPKPPDAKRVRESSKPSPPAQPPPLSGQKTVNKPSKTSSGSGSGATKGANSKKETSKSAPKPVDSGASSPAVEPPKKDSAKRTRKDRDDERPANNAQDRKKSSEREREIDNRASKRAAPAASPPSSSAPARSNSASISRNSAPRRNDSAGRRQNDESKRTAGARYSSRR